MAKYWLQLNITKMNYKQLQVHTGKWQLSVDISQLHIVTVKRW